MSHRALLGATSRADAGAGGRTMRGRLALSEYGERTQPSGKDASQRAAMAQWSRIC